MPDGPAAPAPGGGRRAALALLFLLSGATSLVYEVSWTRRLVLLVGSTATASSLLLAAFMLGLALGARLGGPWADRSRNPLRLYAWLEAAAAGTALLLPLAMDLLGGAPALTGAGREPILFAAAFLLLLVPTTLLGATFPALVRAAVTDTAAVGSRVGLLYAANTLGAVAGALAAGFFLVEALGVDGSARAAVAVNLLVAVAAGVLSLEPGGAPAVAAADPAESDPPPAPAVDLRRAAMAAAFLGGFAGLAAEVAWTRLLVFFLQGFTAAFAAMLGAFLLGSAAGSWWFGRVAERSRRPLLVLAGLQGAAGVAVAASLLVLRGQYDVVQALRGALAWFDAPSANHHLVLLVGALVVVGPPAFFMGGIVPAAVRTVAGGLGDLGAHTGRVYFANTLGAVGGALAAGFVGLPLLGAGWTAAALAGVAVGAAAWTLRAHLRAEGSGAGRRPVAVLAGGAALAAALLALAAPGEPTLLRSQVFRGPRGRENVLLDWREGRTGTASVVRNRRNGYTSLYTDEFLAASTEGRYRYMRMLGHIPVVLAEDPARVLVMAFGTGTTAGSLSTHPSLERLDIVEISGEVLDVAHHFASVNRGVLERAGSGGRPEVRVFQDDARRFVLASPDLYDVITLEPLLPYTPGAVHLYTREFYELCRRRLSPGGAMCQWIPVHAMSGGDFAMLTRSFTDVFPETSLWFVEETVALVGTVGPQGLPVARSRDRLAAPGPREDLEAGRLDDLAQWWSFRVCGPGPLARWLERAGAEAMTDEHPLIEFHPVPSFALTTFLHDNLVVALDMADDADRAGGPSDVDLAGLTPAEAAGFRERYAAARAATLAFMDGRASEDSFQFHAAHTRLERDAATLAVHRRRAEEALRTAVGRYAAALSLNPRDRIVADRWRSVETVRLLNEGRARLAGGDAGAALEAYRAAVDVGTPWNADEAHVGVARAWLDLGRPVAAREALDAALAIHDGNRDAQALMGRALVALGRPRAARPWFERAYEGGSGPADEDTALRNARRAADEAREPDPQSGGVPPAAEAEAEAALREALAEVAGADGQRRERALAVLREGRERRAPALDRLLAPQRAAALDEALAPEERVRALSILAAAGDPTLSGAVLSLARGAAGDRALARAAADVAAEARDPVPLAALLADRRSIPAATRERAADHLASLHDPRSVDAVLDGMEDPEEAVRTAAYAAFFRLTERKEGFDPAAPAASRSPALAAFRAWWAGARGTWK